MIRECRVADVAQAKGQRVLIMRRWPRGLKRTSVDVWVPDLGPSAELLKEYRDGLLDWQQFETRYKWEQADRRECRIVRYVGQEKADVIMYTSPLQVLRKIEEAHGDVTVMCWENCERCHRYTLLKMYGAIYHE